MYSCIKLLWFKPTQFDLVALILSHTQRELFLFPKMTSQLEKGGEGGGRSPSESLPLPRAEGAGRALQAGISCWVFSFPTLQRAGDFGRSSLRDGQCLVGGSGEAQALGETTGLPRGARGLPGAHENHAGFQPRIPAPRSSFGSNCPMQSIRRGHRR